MRISLGKVSSILSKVRIQAKEDIKTWLDDRLPYEYAKSLTLIEKLAKRAQEISNSSEDERIVLASLSLIRELDQSKRDLLSSSAIINHTVSWMEATRQKILQSQIDLKSEVAVVTARLDDEEGAAAGADEKQETKEAVKEENEEVF